MFRVTKGIDVDFAHHVSGHLGACINLHGHTWKFEVALEAEELTRTGFVVDFKELKRKVLQPVHQLLDHSLALGEPTFLNAQRFLDELGKVLLATRGSSLLPESQRGFEIIPHGEELAGAYNVLAGGMKVAVFPFIPTSELLAKWLYDLAEEKLGSDRVSVSFARVYETQHPVQSVATYYVPAWGRSEGENPV